MRSKEDIVKKIESIDASIEVFKILTNATRSEDHKNTYRVNIRMQRERKRSLLWVLDDCQYLGNLLPEERNHATK